MQLKTPHAIDEFVNCYGSRNHNTEKKPHLYYLYYK